MSTADISGVARVFVTLDGTDTELTGPGDFSGTLTAPAVLVETPFTMTVTAIDRAGNITAVDEPLIIAAPDTSAPTITLTAPAPGAQMPPLNEFDAVFDVADDRLLGAMTLTFAGGEPQQHAFPEGSASALPSFPLIAPTVPGLYDLTFQASDRAGNASVSTTVQIEVIAGATAFPKPVTWWTFDTVDLIGTKYYARDVVGDNDFQATVNNVRATASGRQGQALDFYYYADSYASLPGATNLDFTDELTIALWVQVKVWNDRGGILFQGTNSDERWALVTNADGTIAFQSNAHVSAETVTTGVLPASQWKHVVATFDRGTATIYVDGQLQEEATWSVTSLDRAGFQDILVGRYPLPPAGNGRFYIDETMLFDQALTAPQVQTLFDAVNGGPPLDLRPPEEVTDVAIAVTGDSLTLSWTPSANGAGDLIGTNIYVDDAFRETLAIGVDNLVLSELTPDTNVTVRIATVDGDNNESYGPRLYLATPPAEPALYPKPVSFYTMDNDHIDTPSKTIFDLRDNADLSYASLYTNQAAALGEAIKVNSASNIHNPAADHIGADGDLTFSAWIKVSSYADDAGIVYLGDTTTDALVLETDSHNRLRLQAGNTGDVLALSKRWRPTNAWQHVVGVFDHGTARLYVDGELAVETSGATLDLPDPAQTMLYLAKNIRNNKVFNGWLDDVAVWNVALSEKQVRQLFTVNAAGEVNTGGFLDFDAPADTTDITAVAASATSLSVSWPLVIAGDLAAYRVLVDGVPVASNLAGPPFLVTGLAPGTVYQITVQTVDTAGNTSPGYTVPAATLPANPALELPEPTSLWTMNGTAGSLIPDEIGANDLTIDKTPTLSQPGPVDTSMKYDYGATAHRDAPSGFGDETFSLAGWVNVDNIYNLGALVYFGDNSSHSWRLVTLTGNKLGFANGAGTTVEAPITLDTWHHMALVYNGGAIDFYVDGRLTATADWGPGALATVPSAFLRIGRNPNGPYYRGYLDELAFWDSPLDEADVVLFYQMGKNGTSLLDPLPTPKRARPDALEDIAEIDEESVVLRGQTVHLADYVTAKILYLHDSELIIDGELRARAIVLRGKSILRHPPRTDREAWPLSLVADRIEIGVGSAILLDGLAAPDPDADFGVSHGGIGDGEDRDALYGSLVYPMRTGRGEAGGGAVVLETRDLVLDGRISARGVGFATGGSVLVLAGELRGRGLIDVAGDGDERGMAGGGRVALHLGRIYRFLGEVRTGADGAHVGTLVLSTYAHEALLLDSQWPGVEGLGPPLALPDWRGFRAGAVSELRNARGSLLALEDPRDLRDLLGLWLRIGEDRYRIVEVVAREDDHWLLQLDRYLVDGVGDGVYELLLLNPERVEGAPGLTIVPGER